MGLRLGEASQASKQAGRQASRQTRQAGGRVADWAVTAPAAAGLAA